MLIFFSKRKICPAILPNLCRYASKSNPKPINSVMVDYLVASFGFSPHKAAAVSKPIAHLKSPDKPEAVRRFLKLEGFSDAQVKTLITLQPKLLYASPEDTLAPNLRALRDIGLSTSILNQLILSSPGALHSSSAAPRITFWRDFFQGDDQSLLRAFKNNLGIGDHDVCRSISPKISFLRSHGLSIHDIRRIVLLTSRIINYKLSALEDALKRAKEFGFKPESGMFVHGLRAMMSVSREVLQKRMELLKSFGWSEDEFLSALCKAPSVVAQSEKCLQAKMDFLIGEAKCDPSYVASCPVLLMCSLEKRLRPRLHVLHLLASQGLSGKRRNFFTYIQMTNTEFVQRFILPHEKEITGLHETYLATCAGEWRKPVRKVQVYH